MLERTVKVHDNYQIETKYGYKISKNKKKTQYNIETYFFVPDSLGINRNTYAKELFYKDIQGHLRLKTPTFLLDQIITGQNSPFFMLEQSIDELVNKNDRETKKIFEYNVKMVCSIVKSALRNYVSFIKKNRKKDNSDLIDKFLQNILNILFQYRALLKLINLPTISEKLITIYKLGDEFISFNVEYYSIKLLDIIEDIKEDSMQLKSDSLKKLIKNEYSYRIENGYHLAPGKEKANEDLVFRRGVLKKYISSVLFLDTNWKPEGKIIEQILIGIAAGLSMFFATLIAFFAQQKYGNLTLPFFSLLVVSYIFKDRIKELTRSYLVGKIRKHSFDHNVDIFSDKKEKIGKYRDGVSFVKESNLPLDIKAIRKKELITYVENKWMGEKVLLYRKRVLLFSKKLKDVYKSYKIDGINDIERLNISRLLNKMDNPYKKIYIIKNNKKEKIIADRVYHINMITKITKNEKIFYNRYRIILTSKGIKRVEKIKSDLADTLLT